MPAECLDWVSPSFIKVLFEEMELTWDFNEAEGEKKGSELEQKMVSPLFVRISVRISSEINHH